MNFVVVVAAVICIIGLFAIKEKLFPVSNGEVTETPIDFSDFGFMQMDMATSENKIFLFHSAEELNAYYTEHVGTGKEISELSALSYESICKNYDEAYFENQILVLVWLAELDSASDCEVTKVFFNEENKLEIRVTTILLENDDAIMGEHLFISPAKGISAESSRNVTIVLDDKVMVFE